MVDILERFKKLKEEIKDEEMRANLQKKIDALEKKKTILKK